MKERGKAVDMYSNGLFEQDYSTSSDLPCKKHPSSSSVGICAYCLKDRLVKLVCSDCGEQRLSSCSCSEISSNRNSCTVDVGSVGRISFLLENDQKNEILQSNSKPKSAEKAEEVFLLKRSSSSCVEIKRKGGFWSIGRLFRKKREKGCDQKTTVGGFEENSDLWVVDYMGSVSRSRSLCSFRGGGFFGSEDGTFSGARSSISAARSSGVNGGLLFDPDRKSGFSEAEPRKSGFDADHQKKDTSTTTVEPDRLEIGFNGANSSTRRVFSLKEGNFTTVDDSGFIDLKFDFPSDSKAELSAAKMGALSDTSSAFGSTRLAGDFVSQDQYYQCGGGGGGGGSLGSFVGDHGGSCRITVSDRGIKRSRKSFKSWRWIFRQNYPSGKKKDEVRQEPAAVVKSNHG